MILVLSNIANEAAPALVNSLPAGAASLVTASDFYKTFRAGVSVNDFASSILCTAHRGISVTEITGVITTIPCFLPLEFYYISAADRDYVCAETNAFLQYFLTELRCSKCNPPDWKLFIGGQVHKLIWARQALKQHIPLAPYHYKNGYAIANDTLAHASRCTVIFDTITDNNVPDQVQQYTRTMADALALPYLDCYFTQTANGDYELVHINSIPDVSITANREIIIQHLLNNVLA